MTDAPVDLDGLEAECQRRLEHAGKFRNFIPFMNIDARQLSAIIEELRAARAPVAGVVTREHRKVVAALVRESDGNPSLAAWVSDGDVNEGNWWICDACVMDAAQAIADAEARGAARAVSQEASGLLFTDEWLRKGIASDGDADTEAGLPLPLFEPTPMIAEPLSPESFQAAARFHAAPPADEVAELLGPECEHGLRNCFECPGLERDMLQVRCWIGTPDDEDFATENEAGHTLTIEALDRIENHLKGKR